MKRERENKKEKEGKEKWERGEGRREGEKNILFFFIRESSASN